MDSQDFLYRIASFRHVVDLFENRQLHFTMPQAWDDPFEQIVEYSKGECVFAQCWTKRESSDAMWRIYSADRMSLSMRTTRAKLKHALDVAKAQVPMDFLVEDVEYLSKRDPVTEASRRVHEAERSGTVSLGVMRALLLKRAAFDHEEEVRAVVHVDSNGQYGRLGPSFRLPVDPHALIDELVFDPRADSIFMSVVSHYLRSRLCFEGKIGRSDLYEQSPEFVVV